MQAPGPPAETPAALLFFPAGCSSPSSCSAGAPPVTAEEDLGALQKCEMREARLTKLSMACKAFGDASWAQSDPSELLITKLKSNPFFLPLRAQISRVRMRWLAERAEELNMGFTPALAEPKLEPSLGAEPGFEPSLSMKASNCSHNVAMELRQLRALETQAQHTVQNMMATLSTVVPVCKEEVRCARDAAGVACSPATVKLAQAIDDALLSEPRVIKERNADTRKRGQISAEAKAVLEDWLDKNIETPCPSQEETQRLARITKIPVRQIGIWLGNERQRILYPAIEAASRDSV